VNIPAFRVLYVDGDRARMVSRVVVGKPFTQTPIFRADMTYLVLNPSWTIPPGIMKRDVIPGMKKDPGYLEKKGYVKVGNQIVQPPGPHNALGRIKLMFPNRTTSTCTTRRNATSSPSTSAPSATAASASRRSWIWRRWRSTIPSGRRRSSTMRSPPGRPGT
jgi:hypothetical protein